jgi:DsbC/DsbD-like thiol-disulfide interchange protein
MLTAPLLLTLALAPADAPIAGPAGQGPDAPVKTRADRLQVEAVAGRQEGDGPQRITLKVSIDEGWYVYANPAGNENLENAALTVTVRADAGPEKVSIDYPAGKLVKDRVVGDWRRYEGRVEIPVTVWRAQGDTGPLEITVHFYPRNAISCGGVESKTVSVPSSGPATRPK